MTPELMLALETSTLQGSVVLVRDGRVAGVRAVADERRNAAGLFPAVRDLLSQAGARLGDVALVAYSCGPGSFTGLRVAATTARMMHSTVGCRVVKVPTADVIAENAVGHPDRPARVGVVLDAGRGRIFGSWLERRGDAYATVQETGQFEPVGWLSGLPRPVWVTGAGIARHREALAGAEVVLLDESYWAPRAEAVATLGARMAAAGRICRPEDILPLYIRPPECEEVYEARRAAARARRGE